MRQAVARRSRRKLALIVTLSLVGALAGMWQLGVPDDAPTANPTLAAYPQDSEESSAPTQTPPSSTSPSPSSAGTRSPSTSPSPSSSGTRSPSTSPSPSTKHPAAGSARGVTIAAVGDMVCDPVNPGGDDDGNGKGPRQCQQKAVADQVAAHHPDAFLTLGDNQYVDGTLAAFRTGYAPTFGRLLDITHPAPGNHAYHDGRGAGYFGYFGSRAGSPDKGYYSYDLGGWHLVALNSNCTDVACETGSAQERWLRADLAAHPASCTLAYWHHPRWSHGQHGDIADVAPLMQALYDAKAEIVLNGHDHNYERFTPRSPDGSADPNGVREFVVGTGGRSLRAATSGSGTEVIDSDSFGALFLTLTPHGYRWSFGATNGTGFTDSGSATCH